MALIRSLTLPQWAMSSYLFVLSKVASLSTSMRRPPTCSGALPAGIRFERCILWHRPADAMATPAMLVVLLCFDDLWTRRHG
ncbi:hypothetical protein CC80DRAFT_493498 [Byssothecium circinans]|uniref:Uncharacterized protein n=1 Tax=Byssothecium circinans TaxID=147558 RepID=A0A6A5TSR3_9PLEO|nr:hypothetical protein CC80DRAFT_493498 [Byssothecium circinans]